MSPVVYDGRLEAVEFDSQGRVRRLHLQDDAGAWTVLEITWPAEGRWRRLGSSAVFPAELLPPEVTIRPGQAP
jgi:hypothetical protein